MCVLEKTFRSESITSLELDPAHYLSTPGYGWDAMLKYNDVNLKLISDIESINSLKRNKKWYFYDFQGVS